MLDCFAGGGAIPLEALRLGCEAYALELNPVAHLIELCTLVYPQKYGKPDPNAVGCDKGRWAGLAKEVEYWGKWVLEKVKAEIGGLYPPIPDPKNKTSSTGILPVGTEGILPVKYLQQELEITRRNLPHWQLGGSTYFVTFRTKSAELTSEYRNIVLAACRYFERQRYKLWALVVMTDHVHILLQPLEREKGQWWSLSSILHSIKSFSAKSINAASGRQGFIWQDESFDRIVRDEDEFLEKWNYIRNNPVKNGLSATPEEWDGFYENNNGGGTGILPVNNEMMSKKITGKMPVPLYLTPVAYLWTRTVPCKNPGCGAIVPLVRQTWLCKKAGHYIALRVSRDEVKKAPAFTAVRSAQRSEAEAVKDFDFDPGKFSKAGNAACVFCGTVADSKYVKQQAQAGKMGRQLMAVVATRPGQKGKIYLGENEIDAALLPDDEAISQRLAKLCNETGLTVPDEPMNTNDPTTVAGRGFGITQWHELFTPRQLLTLMMFVKWVRQVEKETTKFKYETTAGKAIITMLGLWIDKISDFGSSHTHWHTTGEKLSATFARQALPMIWDFPEINPMSNSLGNALAGLNFILEALRQEADTGLEGFITRGSATDLPYNDNFFDAVITDPPYYDNISYAALSDFFYVWIRRSIGHLYPDHFASELTPKRNEAIADSVRHGGKDKAHQFYEEIMQKSLKEIYRVLKQDGVLTIVYAHKTVAGWSTLVNALRLSRFVVIEAWPLDTEMGARLLAMDTSALASSIFIVARKRDKEEKVGDYQQVKANLNCIVKERVKTLWEQGITGADLIIACVGAGLKAFTQYEKVELESGEEVSPERFLTEVEGAVQETILEYLFGSRARVSALDAPTKFYLLWRYAYGRAEIDSGEAIVFSYPLGVELDGPKGLATGRYALLEKKGKKYRLRDFTERGNEESLGLKGQFGLLETSLVDVLHRLLWLMENRTLKIDDFLNKVMPHTEELRLVAQALSGSTLQGGGLKLTTDAEQGALQKLLSNWGSIIEENLFRKK